MTTTTTTNYYEYKHPIINLELSSNDSSVEPKKFDTLDDWYNVINDYEYQARCPIILKNSHRNKHFTFACHLKGCPFKVLLSYCGNSVPRSTNITTTSSTTNTVTNDDQAQSTANSVVDDSLKQHNTAKDDVTDELMNVNDNDANVTAAIEAAVAAVQTVSHTNDDDDDDDDVKLPNHTKITVLETLPDLKSHVNSQSNHNNISGPFIVTKIEPYHSHSLEENLSLDKFVLTKIPKILQIDLNFDETLEILYRKGNNTLNKFKVVQFVEDSGLLDIIKSRYNLMDEDITKKFISLISRRVTTYKARFVLKKKRIGEYKMSPGPSDIPVSNEPTDVLEEHNKLNSKPGLTGPKSLHPPIDNTDITNNNANPDDKDLTATAQAAIGDLKRRIQESESNNVDVEDNLEDYSQKRHKAIDDSPLVHLDDIQNDDKLPHDVAEQLRLLSSHFKDVETASNKDDDEDDENKHDVEVDIPDENIQPELRGQ
ncbi:hypothetical protein KAFR_0A00650 [Kazachstania africana CBS 2517]|uniref:Uncharacterized protein n=1 Tax=Kazachstania africana (strain ATCC 22294 / BCRC 22015 / CBS 2517 / CECT 1963 / NBRC 1671 / NRRL Y-8276) TaxID=1071382 RepID=H2AMA3_KAZAF|nr:hypothetical protein KAFR_0A00650 [Kazachstania africana CBS 2517]CCF55503.1 hypothetical protein KAFR_0A00650 [Kazachstania africana CBS 2517]